MIKFVDHGGGNRGIRLGWKRLGAFVQYSRDAGDNRVLHATLWVARGNQLHYRYPAVTLVGWRPVFSIQ